MESIENFKRFEVENLSLICGGEIIHTDFRLFNIRSKDAFSDDNGNGKVDSEEQPSFSLVVNDAN